MIRATSRRPGRDQASPGTGGETAGNPTFITNRPGNGRPFARHGDSSLPWWGEPGELSRERVGPGKADTAPKVPRARSGERSSVRWDGQTDPWFSRVQVVRRPPGSAAQLPASTWLSLREARGPAG